MRDEPDLFEIEELTDFFKEALIRERGSVHAQHPFKLFYIEDIEDDPFIQVVAESVTVHKSADSLNKNS